MKEIRLNNPNYVTITDPIGFSYGGNQGWFSKAHKFGISTRLNRFGCGTIALADLWLYLSQAKGKTDLTAPLLENSLVIKKEDYMNYIRMINSRFTHTVPYLGMNGISLMYAFNSYSKKYNLDMKAHYRAFLNNRSMLSLIIDLLQKNIPVILAIGPNFPEFWSKFGIPFYTKDAYGNYMKTSYESVHSHYVTVTGIDFPSSQSIMLQFSSWGKKFYISYWEFRKYVNRHGSRVTSGLLECSPL